jgi:hypothetical protein
MANNFLILGTLAALGWAFVNGSPPSTEPKGWPTASRIATTDSSIIPYITAGRGPALDLRRDPVPIVRNFRVSPAPPVSAETQAAAAEQQAQDDLDRRAAKAAVEQDGYKRVSILGKVNNGAWRAKGYRGTTAVQLTVDSTGRVSMD